MENIPDTTRWIRLPKAGKHCPFSGLSKASLYLIAKRPEVDSRKIYPTQGRRGILVIRLDSLLTFIGRQESCARVEEVSLKHSGEVAFNAPIGNEEGGDQ